MLDLRSTIASGLLVTTLLFLATKTSADMETLLHSLERESCGILVTSAAESRSIIFRIVPRAGASLGCGIDQKETLQMLSLTFTLAHYETGGEDIGYRSIFFGRLIDYKWLSRHLSEHAEQDVAWSATEGKAKNGERAETYVQHVLAVPSVLNPIDEALKPYGYRASGFSCEKALISEPDTTPFQPG